MFQLNIVTILTVFVFCLAILRYWFLSEGKLRTVYKLDLGMFSVYFVLELYLALSNPSQGALILFSFVNIWGFIMAVKGLLRLNNSDSRE